MNADLKAYPEYQEVRPPRTLADISADILPTEKEANGLLNEITGMTRI